MAIVYEWVIESVDTFDDITDTVAYDSYAQLRQSFTPTNDEGGVNRIVLVREVWTGDELEDRTWAYLADGILPTHFSGTNGRPIYKVPAKYLNEMAKQAV